MMMPSPKPGTVVSVLHAAAGSGSADCFKAALAAVDPDEVWNCVWLGDPRFFLCLSTLGLWRSNRITVAR